MQSEQLFEAASGVSFPWYAGETRFDAEARTLTIQVDFRAGSRFEYPGVAGEHPVHDTQTKRYRHLNFFEHECFLEVLSLPLCNIRGTPFWVSPEQSCPREPG